MPYSVVSLYHSYIILYVTITDFCNFYFNLSHQFLYPVHVLVVKLRYCYFNPSSCGNFFSDNTKKKKKKYKIKGQILCLKKIKMILDKDLDGSVWYMVSMGIKISVPKFPRGFNGELDSLVNLMSTCTFMISCSQGATSFLVSKRQLDF